MNFIKKYALFIVGILLFFISFLVKNSFLLKLFSFIVLILNSLNLKKILNSIIIITISIICFIFNHNDAISFLIIYELVNYIIKKLHFINESGNKQKKIFNKSKICSIISIIISLIIFSILLLLKEKLDESIYTLMILIIISNLNYFKIFLKYLYKKAINYCNLNDVELNLNVLEDLYKCKNVCIEKSGVITTGNYIIEKIFPYYKKEEEILYLLAHAEYKSDHEIAKCILNKYNKEINEELITKYNEYKNLGIIAKINEDELIVGNELLFKKKNINFPKVEFLGTSILVALNGNYIGTIILKDEIKFESFDIRNLFNSININNIIIISSDQKRIVKKIAQNLNINKYYNNVLQEDKFKIISKLGSNTLYIGSSIEAKKNLDFILASTNKNSDLILKEYNIKNIVNVISASTKLNKIIKKNIIATFIYKLILIILTISKLTNLTFVLLAEIIYIMIYVLIINKSFKEVNK